MPTPFSIPYASLEAIFRRAAVDAEYRAWLQRDPHAAVADVAPGVLPLGVRAAFTTRPPSVDALFVLPDLTPEQALSEAELEAVAGGADVACDPVAGTCLDTCAVCTDNTNGCWTTA